MCGITGTIGREPLREDDLDGVARMNAALLHRGPDGAGEFRGAHVALAMRRLSIIDVAGGWQPLYNEDRSLALIANGEIYNFVELRAALAVRGHRFATRSDCETIVHLYEEHGVDCVQHLRGMFAFALWDSRRQRLLLARDRMGEKPLYLHERDGLLVFASELKALLRCGKVPFELEPAAVDLYFHYQYVPEPATPLRGVRKLPAAHRLVVDVNPWRVTEECYWRMEDAPPLEDSPPERLRAELEALSAIVIRSDVPVGVALSGGLDSSAIAALAVRAYPDTMHAFSVGYPGRPPSDERADAQALATHLGMPFHDVELSTPAMADGFADLVYWRDDPIADISGYGYYAVMRAAREQGVPVMLQGQGGDELFWGYGWVQQAARESRAKDAGRISLLASLALGGPTNWPGGRKAWLKAGAGLRTSWHRFQRYRDTPADQLIFYDLTPDFVQARHSVADLYAPRFNAALNGANPAALFTLPHPWPRVDIALTRLICETYLRENGVVQGDRLSMASSVELRLPLLDHRLVETVIGLRKAQPDDGLAPKAWMKAALRGIVPEWVMQRPKRGFAPPVHDWHRAIFERHGASLVDGILVQAGVLKPERARALATGAYPRDAITPLSFKALVLESWCRRMSG